MNDEERQARVRELREMLDAQAARDTELVRELRELTGTGAGEINDRIRAATGRGRATSGEGGQSMNDAIRRAAGRPPASGEETGA